MNGKTQTASGGVNKLDSGNGVAPTSVTPSNLGPSPKPPSTVPKSPPVNPTTAENLNKILTKLNVQCSKF